MPAKIVDETRPINRNVTKVVLNKGLTIPTEPYGGDKFGSIRIDLSMEMLVENGDVSGTVEKVASYIDQHLNRMAEEEIKSLKK